MPLVKGDMFAITCLVVLKWLQRETDGRAQYKKLDFFRKIISAIPEATGDGYIAKVIAETKTRLASVEEFAKKFPTIDREVTDMFVNDLRLVRRGDLAEIPEMMAVFKESIPAILQFMDVITNDAYGFIHQTTIETRVKMGDVIHPLTMILLGALDKSRDFHSLRQLKIYVASTSKITIKDAMTYVDKERARLNDDLRRSGKGTYGTPILDEVYANYSAKTDIETNNHSYKYQCVNSAFLLASSTAGVSV